MSINLNSTFVSYEDYSILEGKSVLIRARRGAFINIPYDVVTERKRLNNLRANKMIPELGSESTFYDIFGNDLGFQKG